MNSKMKDGILPNSLGIVEDQFTEKKLLDNNFRETSSVKGMFLDLPSEGVTIYDFKSIKQVTTESLAIKFAEIASKSFGYTVKPKTVISLLDDDSKIKLYLGSNNGDTASCGIIFIDKHNISGIHMIGTIPEHRGNGLGGVMTANLISEAYKSPSNTIVLVASESGEKIYSKIGFVADKALKSYSAK